MIFSSFHGFGAENPASLPVLKLNSTGPYVVKARDLLASHGFVALGTTDYFGPIMQGAVTQFQRAKGLSADGIIGVNTWSALLGVAAPRQYPPQTVVDVDAGGAQPTDAFVGPVQPKKSVWPLVAAAAVAAKFLLF